jgi:hypothetical protein
MLRSFSSQNLPDKGLRDQNLENKGVTPRFLLERVDWLYFLCWAIMLRIAGGAQGQMSHGLAVEGCGKTSRRQFEWSAALGDE